jgi:ribosomal protein L29
MTSSEIKKLSDEQLKTKLREGRDELFALKQKASTEKAADTSIFSKKRASIARVLTEMNARRHSKAAK